MAPGPNSILAEFPVGAVGCGVLSASPDKVAGVYPAQKSVAIAYCIGQVWSGLPD